MHVRDVPIEYGLPVRGLRVSDGPRQGQEGASRRRPGVGFCGRVCELGVVSGHVSQLVTM